MLSVDTAPPISRAFRPNTDSEPAGRDNSDFELTLQAERQELDASHNTGQPVRTRSTTAIDGTTAPRALARQENDEPVDTAVENDPPADPLIEASQPEADSTTPVPQQQMPVKAEPEESTPRLETIAQPEEITAVFLLAENVYIWQNLPSDAPAHAIAAEQRAIEPVIPGPGPGPGPGTADLQPGALSGAELVAETPLSPHAGAVIAVTGSDRRAAADSSPLSPNGHLTRSAADDPAGSALTSTVDSAGSDVPSAATGGNLLPGKPTTTGGDAVIESAVAAAMQEMVLTLPTETALMKSIDGVAPAALPGADVSSIAEAISATDIPGSSPDEIRHEMHRRNPVDQVPAQDSESALTGNLADSETGNYESQQNLGNKPDPQAAPISHGRRSNREPDQEIDQAAGERLVNANGLADIDFTNLAPAHHHTSGSGNRDFADSLKSEEVLFKHSEQWNQIEKSDVLSQVLEKVRLFRAENNSEIVISLKPESLGRISLRASIVDHTIVATIIAESEKVKNLLEFELPLLHRTLQQHGMPARVEVLQGSDANATSYAGGQSHSQNPSFRESQNNANSWVLNNTQDQERDPAGRPEINDSRYVSRSIHLIA